MGEHDSTDDGMLETLIAEASASGGSERANYQLFIERLCAALDLPRPEMARPENDLNDYVFERRIDFKHADGSRTAGFIDCYKRGCFILEAKQSVKRRNRQDPDQAELLSEDARQVKPGHANRGTRAWDQVMLSARKQAEDYARALPVEHGYPPFLLIFDVGHVIEIYADFSGQGKNYAHFPDRRTFRISLEDLRDEDIRARLRAIWSDPHALDPAKRSAEVTRDIAERLARIAKRLEGQHDPRDVAEFLMRCLFTMFAEDVELIPKHSFERLLEDLKDRPEAFVPALESLWAVMDRGGFEPRMMTTLKRFNGSLFKTRRALPLDADGVHELRVAAHRDWRDVEPAIFGTLLERALDPRERSKLGAHYTPRAYVERLVVPTIIEPLRAEWDTVQARIRELHEAQKDGDAVALVKRFHHRLCTIRVLDPACGTGNFLYVSLELLKRLEGEVLEALDALGEDAPRFAMEGETVGPRQFYGLEINPRAVAIADLVLWIGFLKWQLRTNGLAAVTEPVLDAYGTIRHQDAILAYDSQELLRDQTGKPLSRWDGVTKKPHPVTGEEVPDPSAQMPLYAYVNPRPAEWPEVEFIVGNPPFIGGKDMRAELGDGYAEAAWKARPHIPGGADFVMHFWDEAARRLARKGNAQQPNPLLRFGFITTNSVTQTFSRRVIETHLSAKEPISLVFAVSDHPWMKAADKAAVRIAMTVAENGQHEGLLAEVVKEVGLDTDTPQVTLEKQEGKINAKLEIGADLSLARPLSANASLAYRGVQIIGSGFIVTPQQAILLGLEEGIGLENYIFEYRNGRDIAQRPRGVKVIDLFELSLLKVKTRYPAVFQHILNAVKPERDQNNRKSYRENWWVFGEPRTDMRSALKTLPRYITTIETAKHRFFQFLDASIRPDNMLVNIGLDRPEILATLSSRTHVAWAINTGGWLGVGNDPRYSKTRTFDPYPFPNCVTDKTNPEHSEKLAELGERLDTFRKERLETHEFLTMTGLYNVMERLRELENGCAVEPLSDKERAIHEAGLVSVLKEIHDDVDRAVFEAYGWTNLADRLVGRPGATVPSPHKTTDQEAAEEELLSRLVTLNLERQEEERRGTVRWLRPDYQIPKLGAKVADVADAEQIEADIALVAAAGKPKWPRDGLEQIRIVKDVLAKAAAPALAEEIAATFDGRNSAKRKDRVADVLETLVVTGAARTDARAGEDRYFIPR